MNKTCLLEVLRNTTCLISNGEKTLRKIPGVPLLLWGLLLPSTREAQHLTQVDCYFVTVGVNREQAEKYRETFLSLLDEYPESKRLAEGPSYKHVADVVGDEMTALRFFGLGQALGLWDVLLPDQFDVDPSMQEEAADLGLITTTGYEVRAPRTGRLAAVG
jgi:hypothetical protein